MVQTPFYRVEFQQCSSPHIYGLLWIEESLKYGQHKNKDINAYNENIMSCRTDVSEEELKFIVIKA